VTNGNDLRGLLADGAVLAPGVWDPLSALLAREAGFGAVFVSGFAVAATLLGEPDIGLLTQSEVADVARRVCAAVPDTAVIVDADTGYGNDRAATRTTELWEQAGAAGLFLEDQAFPKRCGHMTGKEIIEAGDWLTKLRAVVDARTHLHVTARTDARAVVDLDEAIERGRMAADLGVDAVFVEAPQSVAEYEQIGAALADRGSVLVANMVEGGHSPLLSRDELAELGFGLVINPLTGLLGMVPALRDLFGELQRTGTARDQVGRMVEFSDMTSIVGFDHT
jgi:2-methylisocitrate lyase-like PEP mutase family enzyme